MKQAAAKRASRGPPLPLHRVAATLVRRRFVVAVRGMRKVGETMEPGWTLHVRSSKGELASCYLP